MTTGLVLHLQVDGRPLACARVLVAFAALPVLGETVAVLLPLTGDVVRLSWAGPPPGLAVPAVVTWSVLTLLTVVLMGLGLAGRAAAAGTSLLFAVALLADRQVFSNHLLLLVLLTALMAAGRPSARWSLDSRRHGPGTTALWPLLLMMSQASTMYVFAGLSKLNPGYLTGTVLQDRLVLPVDLPAAPALALLTALSEIVLGVALWPVLTRRLAAAAGVLLHLSIVLLLGDPVVLAAFGLLAVSTYPLFLSRPVGRGSQEAISPARP